MRERAKRENWYTIPNAMSASRLLISPVIYNLIMRGNYEYALYLNIYGFVNFKNIFFKFIKSVKIVAYRILPMEKLQGHGPVNRAAWAVRLTRSPIR